MITVLSFLLRLLSPPLLGIVAGLTIQYQLVVCWFNLTTPQFIVVCCLVPPALLVTTPVGLVGEVVAAWGARLTVTRQSLFGIVLYRADQASPWRLGRMRGPLSFQSTTVTARDGAALRRRHLIFVLGSTAMQSLIAVLCLVGGQSIYSPLGGMAPFRPAALTPFAFLFPNTPLIASLNLLAISHIAFGLSSLVLTRPGTPPSPGRQLLNLLREPHIDRDIAIVYLQEWLLFGARPRDWQPDLAARLNSGGTAGTELTASLYLFYYHEDRGETEAAQRHLLRAVELSAGLPRVPPAVAVEAAYVAGLHHRDGAKAREWLSQVKPEEAEAHTRARAEAAALLAERQYSRAIAMAEQGLEASWKSADPGGAKAERDWLQNLIAASWREMGSKP
jgi:hypothetical protein